MKATFSINCPLTEIEAMEICEMFKNNDFVELYCGINKFQIINIGIRNFPYNKRDPQRGVISKISYMIKNNI